jgi:hypothetical protein
MASDEVAHTITEMITPQALRRKTRPQCGRNARMSLSIAAANIRKPTPKRRIISSKSVAKSSPVTMLRIGWSERAASTHTSTSDIMSPDRDSEMGIGNLTRW